MLRRTSPVKRKTVTVVVDTAKVGNCSAELKFDANTGLMDSTGSTGTALSTTFDGRSKTTYDFLSGTGLGNLDCYAQPYVGSFTSGLSNTWQRLNATRTWTRSAGASGSQTVSFYLRFRSNTTQQEITSMNCSVTLTATNDSTATDTK